MKKIKIGYSDYTREQMENGEYGIGAPKGLFIGTIRQYEANGYEVKFETNIFRRIFGETIYKVVAYKKTY